MKATVIILLLLVLSGCSTLSFTRDERKFDGTVHAVSAVLCTGYWATHNGQGERADRPFHRDAAAFTGLALYGVVDLGFSLVGDLIVLPVQWLGGGPGSAVFDEKDHKPLPCGTLQHSINVIGAM